MSFRGDEQRRYGHIPPVQYPIANDQIPGSPNRRLSFNSGDDGAATPYAARPGSRSAYQPTINTRGLGQEELFLASPTEPGHSRLNYGSTNSAMSGYQHQYAAQTPPTPSTYNPQTFVGRAQSQSLPYHPHAHPPPAPSRYGAQSAAPYSPTSTTTPSYTPAPYNPAAYTSTSPAIPQRQSTYAGSAYGSYNSQSYSPTPAMNPSNYVQSQPSYASLPAQAAQTASPPTTYPAYDQISPGYPPYDATQSQYPAQNAYPSSATSPPGTSYSTSSSQAPYPNYSDIPVGPNYSANDPHSFLNNRASRSSSQASPLPSPPVQGQPPSPGLQRHPTNAPLPSRPAAESPWEESNGTPDGSSEYMTQDDIMKSIEDELSAGGDSHKSRHRAFDQRNGGIGDNDLQNLRRLTSTASYHSTATTRFSSNASTVNRNHSRNPYPYPEDEADESDPEAAAGLMAMQQADEDDRRLSGGMSFPLFSQPEVSLPAMPNLPEEPSSDSDYAAMDLGLFSGGYAGNLTYDNNLATPENDVYPQDKSSTYPAFEQADLDYGGTGGLQAPSAHRLSFDEGDERVSLHSRQSGSDSPYKEDYPDMFYHPGLSNRPLPAIPANPNSDSSSMLSVQSPHRGSQHGYSLSTDSRPYSGPDAYYGQNAQQLQHLPQVQIPNRSRTDAEANRMKHARQQQQLSAQQGLPNENYDAASASSINYDVITLPSGRRKKFIPEKITSVDTRTCIEPWALSGISKWLREMAEGEPDLKIKTVEDGLVRLFCSKVPTMNVADAEGLSTTVVELMLKAGILVPEEEWLKFGPGSITGVIWQLTGTGCYAPKLHEVDDEAATHEVFGRCYSHYCGRTLKKANLDDVLGDGVKKVDWATYYNLKAQDVEAKTKKEIERQNNLHEIITSEEDFMGQLDVLAVLYRDRLLKTQPRIIAENRVDRFVNAVFGKIDALQQINKDHLLAQLKYRQKEQGPWIVGFSDLFREWIRKAKVAYIEYASAYPYATYLVRKEKDRNYMFKQFLEQNRTHARSQKLDWTTFLKAPITRLQRYNLLLGTSMKNMLEDSEEKTNLIKAMDEIKQVVLEADAKVDEMTKKVTMIELDQMLVLRPGFHADLNLDHLGRELIIQGDLQRMGSKGVRWVDTHALLFDHYLILSKLVAAKDGRPDKKYDVSKEPIPMPLLFLESSQDEPVSKQKGIAAPLTRAANSATDIRKGSDPRLNKPGTPYANGDRPGLEHAATNSSIGSVAVTRLAPTNSNDSEGKILWPFRVKHLGHEVYTLFAPSSQARQEWCDKIIEAKTRHAKALHAQNAEPFRLRVVADSAFGYDSVSAMGKYVSGVHIRNTPLDRAIRDLEKTFGPGRGPPPVSRAPVNCATGFSAYGKNMIAVGTDAGVCVAEAGDQRGWLKTTALSRVTQIAVLEEFSVVLVLADRSLISYPLDVIAPPSNFPAPAGDNVRRSPQRLAKDVSFFATARMKDRMLVFYRKKEGLHSTFKVLEPVFQKSTERKTRFFKSGKGSGSTETFREFDDFYLPTECYSINLFNMYIAISTAKGFELMTLDKKIPMSIPDVKQPAIANIASRIRDQKPLGMFRLNTQEFLLAYEDCAVYIDKHSDVSRSVIMEYSGKQKKAKGATMYGQYLLLFNEDYVEVRNAENGRLRQIIAGRDVRVLDYGVRGPTGGFYQPSNGHDAIANGGELGLASKGTVKICMAHPEVAGQQIVLEMLLNNGHSEKV
ncbi:CNH domain-containing protein [Truncatella angustata]|uniref:CNH domain-containing protein n=1 Tax=Truncatella angustata TaxID=152316 RepID=A0A9P8RPJ6_9PEZI|nr:CNH domain-containing protein [Truncatella angustata]KAH6646946.1 CNH domain-containing protein [Truncatella angustata]